MRIVLNFNTTLPFCQGGSLWGNLLRKGSPIPPPHLFAQKNIARSRDDTVGVGRRVRDSFGKARKPVPPLSKGGGLRSKTEGLYLPPKILPSLCSVLLRSSTPLRSAQNDTFGVGRHIHDFYGTTRRTLVRPLRGCGGPRSGGGVVSAISTEQRTAPPQHFPSIALNTLTLPPLETF